MVVRFPAWVDCFCFLMLLAHAEFCQMNINFKHFDDVLSLTKVSRSFSEQREVPT